MAEDQGIRRRIETRIGQGEFLAGLLHVARRESDKVQGDFVAQLSSIAAGMRDLLEDNGMIRRVSYAPTTYWPQVRGQSFAFVDGGVASIDLPSAAPVGIRVGSYVVRPGDESSARERFAMELSLVDDLFSDNGALYDDDFQDIAKLRDAARMTAETAAGYRIAKEPEPPDLLVLHGPLVNPVAPYGLDGFPSFGLDATRLFLNEPALDVPEHDRQFVALYLELLKRLRSTGVPVIGTVERSIGRDPVVLRRILAKLHVTGKLKEDEAKAVFDKVNAYGLNDATLFDVVLQEGEYIEPIAVMRQGPENKWHFDWKGKIREYPEVLTTYLKPSDAVMPFRVEAFENIPDFARALDLVLHTSRLLPSYGFPVGLDIVDRFAKVPSWMSRGIKSQHQVVLLKKALASGDPRALTFAKRVLAAKGRDWLFRPVA